MATSARKIPPNPSASPDAAARGMALFSSPAKVAAIEREVAALDVAAVAMELQMTVSQGVVMVICDVADGVEISRYALGEQQPDELTERRLRVALATVRVLEATYPQSAARFLMGGKAFLGGRSPARCLLEATEDAQFEDVVETAAMFTAWPA